MTEQTPDPTPTPDPSVTAPPAQDAQTGPEPKAPAAKKAAAKKAPAKKAAAPTPPPEAAKKDPRSLYLPALPDGFDYTGITATGPRGETLTITPGVDGKAALSFEGAGMQRNSEHSDMKAAIGAGAKAAKAMAKIAEREAELARVREEAFDL